MITISSQFPGSHPILSRNNEKLGGGPGIKANSTQNAMMQCQS